MANEMVPCSGSSASRSRLGVRCLTRSAPATTALAHLPLLRSGRMSSAAPRSADRRADRVGHQRSDQHPVIAFGRARREGAGTTAARGPRTCSGRRALTGRRARAHALCWHGSARSRRSKPVGQGGPARHSPTRCWPRPRRLRGPAVMRRRVRPLRERGVFASGWSICESGRCKRFGSSCSLSVGSIDVRWAVNRVSLYFCLGPAKTYIAIANS